MKSDHAILIILSLLAYAVFYLLSGGDWMMHVFFATFGH